MELLSRQLSPFICPPLVVAELDTLPEPLCVFLSCGNNFSLGGSVLMVCVFYTFS